MRIAIVAVPYDSARRGERMGAGPERLLGTGLAEGLAGAGHDVRIQLVEAPAERWRAEIGTAFTLAGGVSLAVRGAIKGGEFPLILSGNCGPAALGAVGGLGGPSSVFWFDAHGDFNTPETTVGGFLDGMSLATLAGRCWTGLARSVPGFVPVPERAIALVGARDLDPLEADALAVSGVHHVRVADMRSRLAALATEVTAERSIAYLHLDLDVLDPTEGRVNCYASPGGVSVADLDWAIARITAAARLGAASLTAYDPESDADGRAGAAARQLAVRLAAAAATAR
jgi:arginase